MNRCSNSIPTVRSAKLTNTTNPMCRPTIASQTHFRSLLIAASGAKPSSSPSAAQVATRKSAGGMVNRNARKTVGLASGFCSTRSNALPSCQDGLTNLVYPL